ncbi:MAG: hypothetical protein QXP49_07025, partial [Nitrososphaerota archaeon]
MQDYSYIGSGRVYLRDRNAQGGGLVEIGNVSDLVFSVDEEVKELRDYRTQGGGTLNEVRRIKSVSVSIVLSQIDPMNLSRALYGTTSRIDGGTVTDETHVAVKGALIPLNKINFSNIVVKSSDGSVTYTAGEDYEVRQAGIYILESGDITDGSTIKISYSYGEQDVVQALAGAQGEYELLFEGLNEARSSKPVIVRAWRVRFGALKKLSLIGDDYASLELEGKVLADDTKVAGISRYFE